MESNTYWGYKNKVGDVKLVKEMQLKHTAFINKNREAIEAIFAIISAVVSVLFIRWKVWFYPLAFLGGEILYTLFYHFVNVNWKNFFYKRMPLEKKKLWLEENRESLEECDSDIDSFSELADEAIDMSSENIKVCREKIKELGKTKQKASIGNQEIDSFRLELDRFSQAIIGEKHFKEDKYEFIVSLLNKLEQVISMIKAKPKDSVFASKIFNIYIPETISLLQSVPVDKESYQKYMDNLMIIIREIDELVDATIITIRDFDKRDTEIAFDVLKKEIQKAKGDMNNG